MQEKLKELQSLCELFKTNIKQYKSSNYDEANTRTDFIDKFFELLDWDVRNTQGFAENYREVVREDKVIIQGKPKAPDYSFRIGGFRKFFLEAKKPSVNIKEDIEPAFQVRRYGYTAKLSLCILTDFEELSVYDTRIKPSKNDKASVGRIFYSTYEEYEKNFDFLYNTFSKNAILKGSFDRYVQENKNKKGTSDVDKEFLILIESWRESLAKNIALRNKELDVYTLNTAVQTIIDRIIFLRIAEDRNMEGYGRLLESVKNENTYSNINKIFLKANDKYNSGLFKPEDWITNLKIDDKILQNIIKHLYYPESPYEFSVLPIEILGNIYEQFLGKTIRLTTSHQAKVEEKEEVRKAGGVYYTPQYIVNYIVENTVGEKVKNLNLYEHPKLSVLDPACGSGSFLVGAYSFLLNEYLKAYTNNKNLNKCLKNGLIFLVAENTYRLSIEIKQKILLNHIFGVDIDQQAVEVTKLSLLLKLMEDENTESADLLFKHSDLKLLPDLSDNIKCGNSLISSDFYENKNLSLFGKEEMRKINVFDWENEFPEVFKDDGFDVIIGNPPYGANYGNETKHHLSKQFNLAIPIADTFLMFIQKAYIVSKKSSLISFIVPSTWLYMPQYNSFRNKLVSSKEILEIQLFRKPVFNKVTVETCILKSKNIEPNTDTIYNFKEVHDEPSSFLAIENSIVQQNLLDDKEHNFILTNKLEKLLYNKIQYNKSRLKDVALTVCGLTPYRLGKGKPAQTQKIVKERSFDSDYRKDETYRQYLMGRDFNRYVWQIEKQRWISYGDWLAEPRYKAPFNDEKKIVIRQTSDRLIAHLDEKMYLSLKNVHNLRIINDCLTYEYVLALLNSKLMDWWYQKLIPEKGRVFAEVKVINLEKLPIKLIDNTNEKENKIHDTIMSLVIQMLSTQKELYESKIESDKKLLQQKCDLLDKQIDKLVYELYELTDEEIKIVENKK